MENALLEGPILLRLTSEQISKYWEDIKTVVEHSCPPSTEVSEEGYNLLLHNLLSGAAQAWVMTKDGSVKGMLLTLLQNEMILGTKILLIIGALSYEGIGNDLWLASIETLKKFGKVHGCKCLTAFTKVKRVIQVAESLGWDISWTFIKLDLEN